MVVGSAEHISIIIRVPFQGYGDTVQKSTVTPCPEAYEEVCFVNYKWTESFKEKIQFWASWLLLIFPLQPNQNRIAQKVLVVAWIMVLQ